MIDPNMSARRSIFRKNTLKANDPDKAVNDVLESKQFCPYQTIFLMESTPDSTKYVNVYRDAIDNSGENENSDVIVIDHNVLVDSLINDKRMEKNETYRALHEKAKNYLIGHGSVSTNLMVQLVRYTMSTALESMNNKKRRTQDAEETTTTTTTTTREIINVVLTNFFNLAYVTGLIEARINATAIVELICDGGISQTREKFVSKASRDKRGVADAAVRRFWRDFRDELNTANGSSGAFKDVMVYTYRSKYNADDEPMDSDRIVTAARAYASSEMRRVQEFVCDVKAEYEKFVADANAKPVYALTAASGGANYYYKSYSERLTAYPDEALTVAVILDAMLRTVGGGTGKRRDDGVTNAIDVRIGALKDESVDGCTKYPVCAQYGNECALTLKKYDLRSTEYADAAVNVLKTKWIRALWRSRTPYDVETAAEYDKTISEIRRQCKSGGGGGDDDVRAKLCALALNRLRNNVDVYRGEEFGLTGLKSTRATYAPELMEPAGCTTMVQVLERQSDNYGGMCYMHFKPEDVMLVGFYDGCPAAHKRGSFDATIAQRPRCHFKDYFDYFHGFKKKPECFFDALDATGLCANYRDQTDHVRFGNGDCLYVATRKWKYEPGSVCLRYKSKRWEIVRHVTNGGGGGGGDRFRIYADDDDDGGGGGDGVDAEYCVEKHPHVIRLTCRTSDGGGMEIVSGKGPADYVLRQWKADGKRRVYDGSGRVVVESPTADERAAVTYFASGPVKSDDVKKKNSPSHKRLSLEGSQDELSKKTGSKISESKSRVFRPNRVRHGVGSVMSNSGTKLAAASIATAGTSRHRRRLSKSFNDTCDFDKWIESTTEYSADGTARTVEFHDGTRITTIVRELAPGEPGWVCYVIAGYEYAHPAYRTVEERTDSGEFHVPGLVSRLSRDGRLRLRFHSQCIEFDHDTVAVYRNDDDGGGGSGVPMTFCWNDTVGSTLFEKREGDATTTTVVASRDRDATVGHRVVHAGATTTATVTASMAAAKKSSAEYFIVKRGMSGFRVLDGRQYREFADRIRDRVHTAVRENQHEIVALFAERDAKIPSGRPTAATITGGGGGYRWFTVCPGTRRTRADRREHVVVNVPELLMFRTFRKCDTDYGPISNALRRNVVGVDAWEQRNDTERLAVRVNVPTLDTVLAMYAATHPEFSDQRRRPMQRVDTSLRAMTTRLEQRRELKKDVIEAWTRANRNDFVPYFHCHNYGDTLKKYLVANGLPLCER